jgi:hypothetical protein
MPVCVAINQEKTQPPRVIASQGWQNNRLGSLSAIQLAALGFVCVCGFSFVISLM